MQTNPTTHPLSILHFNDIYDLQPHHKEPKGGAAFFKPLLDQYRSLDPQNTLTLFSGDAFAPALLSNEYQGQNMVLPLNSFKIDVACIGNHDLDYKEEQVKKLMSQTNFPWLLSNVFDKRTNTRLAGGQQYRIIEKAGLRIGIFSLAEKQWIDTLMPDYAEFTECYCFEEYADYMVKEFKSQKVDFIIALTHMMRYNDKILAEKYPQIDLILGGHDHLLLHEKINHSVLVKSGTNFKNFTYMKITKKTENSQNQNAPVLALDSWKNNPLEPLVLSSEKYRFEIYPIEINHEAMHLKPDPTLDEYIHGIYEKFAQRQSRIACYVRHDVDLTFKTIRKQQSSFLEFLVAVYRFWAKADCAFMNCGNFRMDTYVKAGPITYGTLTNVIEDDIIVLLAPGAKIVQALENCVSMYPNLAGRYSALSGIKFTWDCSKPPNSRVLKDSVFINEEPIDLQKIYKVAMHSFMGFGGDGYQAFKDCQRDQKHQHKKNLVLLYELINSTQTLLKGFQKKYPDRIFYRTEEDGRRVLELDLPKPKNVNKIGTAEY